MHSHSSKSSWWQPQSQNHVQHWVWLVLRCNRCTVYCIFPSSHTWHNDIQYSTTWSSVELSKGRPRRLVARPARAPSKSSFLPNITALLLLHLQESRRGFAATLAPGTGPLLPHILKLSFKRGHGKRPDAAIVRIKKKHLRKKSPLLFAPFFIYYYNNTIRGKNPMT